jgi:hypothetical protein
VHCFRGRGHVNLAAKKVWLKQGEHEHEQVSLSAPF